MKHSDVFSWSTLDSLCHRTVLRMIVNRNSVFLSIVKTLFLYTAHNLSFFLTCPVVPFIGVKKYSCQQCDKCFLQRHDLRKHLRVHTGNQCPKLEIVFVSLLPTGRKFGRIIQKAEKKNSKVEEKSVAELWLYLPKKARSYFLEYFFCLISCFHHDSYLSLL
jgi:hypothetical protein